jgi:hypothetical protein
MAIRVETYALARSAPYLIERGATQTLTAPIRYGPDGSLVAPDSGPSPSPAPMAPISSPGRR